MTGRRLLGAVLLAGLTILVTWGNAQSGFGQRRWAEYEWEMQTPVDDPPDAWEETEFAFARLRFRSDRQGRGYARWGIDANRSDRQFIQGLRRLTRIHARSVEHIVDVDSNEIYDWPWLYAVAVGDWSITPDQAQRMRKYFERGGFLMVDDFHSDWEWASFMSVVNQILPGSRVVELPSDAQIFHTVYDLSERHRIPGYNVIYSGGVERGGVNPHWRAVLDENDNVRIAMCFNMDLGDAWEFADSPEYPEKYASLAYKVGVNYIMYALTH
jgi:uncharacterized protein DUF4159